MKTEKTSLSRIPWTGRAVAGTGCTFRLRLFLFNEHTNERPICSALTLCERERVTVVPEQQAMEKLWEEHVASEFKSKSAEAAINTMVERPGQPRAGNDWRGRSQAVDTLLR